jgi:hypothetical protein
MTAPTDAPAQQTEQLPEYNPADFADTSYQQKLSARQYITPEAYADLLTEITQAFEEADAANNVPAMTKASQAMKYAQATATERGLSTTDPDGDGDDDTDPNAKPEADEKNQADGNAPAADTTQTPAADGAASTQEASVPNSPSVPADRQPLPVAAATNVVVAGADVSNVSAGMQFTDRRQFTQALTDKIHAMRMAEGRGEHVLVASVKSADPGSDRTLNVGDFEGNLEKIMEVVGRDQAHVKALVASGGYCAPLEPRYDVFGIGTTDRPVRSALPGFRAQRGGIRFITPPKLSGVTGSAGVWTAATDASPGGATKAKLVVTCGAEQTVSISAITSELQFGNFMARAYPEMVDRNVELAMIAQARLAEQTLLSSISTLSTALTSASVLGTARDLMVTVARAAAGYRARHRMAADAQLTAILPAWARDAIREDISWSLSPTTNDILAESDAEIDSWFAARNVNVSWHLDDPQFYTPAFTGAVADFPSTVVWYLFAPGSFLFLDGGTLDIGVVRDSTLVGTNDYIQFTENFEAVALVGVEGLKITSTTKVLGKTSAAVTTS